MCMYINMYIHVQDGGPHGGIESDESIEHMYVYVYINMYIRVQDGGPHGGIESDERIV